MPEESEPGGTPLRHAAFVRLGGSLTARQGELAFQYTPSPSPWRMEASAGLARFDGQAEIGVEPETMCFRSRRSHDQWSWKALQLAYLELAPARMLTRQLELSYRYRLTVPLSGQWKHDAHAADFPGDAIDLSIGGMHLLQATLNL